MAAPGGAILASALAFALLGDGLRDRFDPHLVDRDARGMTLVEVADLTVSFGSRRAVNGLSFAIEAGQVVGLVGQSGSGEVAYRARDRRPASTRSKADGHDPARCRTAANGG